MICSSNGWGLSSAFLDVPFRNQEGSSRKVPLNKRLVIFFDKIVRKWHLDSDASWIVPFWPDTRIERIGTTTLRNRLVVIYSAGKRRKITFKRKEKIARTGIGMKWWCWTIPLYLWMRRRSASSAMSPPWWKILKILFILKTLNLTSILMRSGILASWKSDCRVEVLKKEISR